MAPLRPIMLSVLAVGASSASHAAEPPKWIIYGFSSDGKGGNDAMFFDQAGMKRQPGNHVQVWTKSLSTKKMDHLSNMILAPPKEGSPEYENYMSVFRSVMARVKSAEQLLYESASPEKVNESARNSMIIYEGVANSGAIEPRNKVLYDIDCSNDMLRVLYLIATGADGHSSIHDTPQAWQHIAPESNGSRFEALVCKPQ